MNRRPSADDYWQAVGAALGGDCPAYTPEELATFAEGRMRKADARFVEAHLEQCASCRELVEALRAEALRYQPAQAVRVRPLPSSGWNRNWVYAPIAVAAVALLVVVAVRIQQAPVPTGGSQPQPVIADRTRAGDTSPLEKAPATTPRPPAEPESGAEDTHPQRITPGLTHPSGSHPRRGTRGHGQPTGERGGTRPPEPHRPAPGHEVPFDQAIAEAPALVNEFAEAVAFSAADVDGLFKSLPEVSPGDHPEMLNDLPDGLPSAFPDTEATEAILASPINRARPLPSSASLWLEESSP